MDTRIISIAFLIMMWFGGCSMMHIMSTEEAINPYTGETVRIQKRYLTWEKGIGSGIFMTLLGTTSAVLKKM